jgi:hypothetical protein
MKSSMEKRLQKLESALKIKQRSKCALVVCDPDIVHTFDFSFIEADYVLILPDNGHRLPKDQPIRKGSYLIRYS